jgi:quinol-cytochrome oxidoreductase complex cytochrome b subunit
MALIGLSLLHLVLLHAHGSTNPLGICSKMDMVRFYPKFVIKDIVGFVSFIGFLVLFTLF